MALLDNAQPQQDTSGLLAKFLQSPQALNMAASLLANSGYSTTPTTLGQALGSSFMTSQQATTDNAYKQASTQELQAKIKAEQQKQALNEKMAALMGAPASAQGVPYANNPGSGLLGGQLSPSDYSKQLAPLLMQAGEYKTGLGLLGVGNEASYGQPVSVIGPDGKPHLLQVDKAGNKRELDGYMPMPKTGSSLTIDPVTNQISFVQGVPMTDAQGNPTIKDPRNSPARGGQGGVYRDPQTGQIISTDTNRMVTNDQTAIAAVERIKPLIDTLIKNQPQFQHATTQAKSHLQGVANKYFGASYDLPSQKAEGGASINIMAEGLMKALGLPSTNEALDMVKSAVTPVSGESEKGYRDRLNRQVKEIVNFQSQSRNRLLNGIPLNDPQAQAQGQPAQQQVDYMYTPGKGLHQ
jgi:hypothetical protein